MTNHLFDRPWLTKLKKDYHLKNTTRQRIIIDTAPLGHEAKKIIFALQRGEHCSTRLGQLNKIFLGLLKQYGRDRLFREGIFRASLEEYIEAVFLAVVLENKKISALPRFDIDVEIYLGALSDVTGELVRRATNLIADRKIDEAKKLISAGQKIVDELLDFDMTGSLRTKYDQARNNLRKLEQLNYEISK